MILDVFRNGAVGIPSLISPHTHPTAFMPCSSRVNMHCIVPYTKGKCTATFVDHRLGQIARGLPHCTYVSGLPTSVLAVSYTPCAFIGCW